MTKAVGFGWVPSRGIEKWDQASFVDPLQQGRQDICPVVLGALAASTLNDIVVMRWRKQQDGIATPVKNEAEIVEDISPQHRSIARFRVSEDTDCPSEGLRSL